MSEIQFVCIDDFDAEFSDAHVLYEHLAQSMTVHDDALFWSMEREEVWVAFALRQNLPPLVTGQRSPAFVSSGNLALYIALDLFPQACLARMDSLEYFRYLSGRFSIVNIGFGQREVGMLRCTFPAQTIPTTWRYIMLRHEDGEQSVRVRKYGSCSDVVVVLVWQQCLIAYNVDRPPFEVQKHEFFLDGVNIIEKRFDAILRPKASALFSVEFKDAYFTLRPPIHNLAGRLNALARNIAVVSTVNGSYWFISNQLELNDRTCQFVVSGLHSDRQSAVGVWRDLLRREVGEITHEELLSEDRTWVFDRVGKKFLQDTHFYAWRRWRALHDEVRNYAFALACVGFPPYIILDLIDLITSVFANLNELKKITLITSVIASMRRVVSLRNSNGGGGSGAAFAPSAKPTNH